MVHQIRVGMLVSEGERQRFQRLSVLAHLEERVLRPPFTRLGAADDLQPAVVVQVRDRIERSVVLRGFEPQILIGDDHIDLVLCGHVAADDFRFLRPFRTVFGRRAGRKTEYHCRRKENRKPFLHGAPPPVLRDTVRKR